MKTLQVRAKSLFLLAIWFRKLMLRTLGLEILTLAFPIFAKNVHSQGGVDGIIDFIVKKLPLIPKYIVDLGANDGLVGSCSRSLILQGWKGTLVEPYPPAFAELKGLYAGDGRGVEVLNVAVSAAPGATQEKINWHGHFEGLTVDAKNINDVLGELPVDTRAEVGVLKVDLDGMDNEILEAIDFSSFCPWLVVGEIDSSSIGNLMSQTKIMDSKGYVCVLHRGNVYYLAKRHHNQYLYQNRDAPLPSATGVFSIS